MIHLHTIFRSSILTFSSILCHTAKELSLQNSQHEKICIVLSAVIALIVFNSFTLQPQGWRFIGDKWAAFGPDRDVLRVGGNDAFRQIKIKVTNGPLRIDDIDIYFEKGEKMNFH